MAKIVAPLFYQTFVVGNTLNLSHQALRDGDMPAVCEFLWQHPELIQLDLSHNQLTEKGAQLLAKVSSIKILNISHNQLGPIGAKYIGTMHQLESLDISDNKILAVGIHEVAKLQSFNLSQLIIATSNATPTQSTEIRFQPSAAKLFSVFVNKEFEALKATDDFLPQLKKA